jgi:hypothetical protein
VSTNRQLTLEQASVHGVPSLRLANGLLAVTVLPAAGGKMLAIEDLRSGRDWLWKNPHLPPRAARYGASYVGEMDSGGWDEILPSVSPCTVDGAGIPDHGDLAGVTWDVEEAYPEGVTLSAHGRSAPWQLRRRLTLAAAEARIGLAYELRGFGDRDVPFLWCAHPLVAVSPGMRIELPDGAEVAVAGAVGRAPVRAGDRFVWPGQGWNAAVVPDPMAAPYAVKLFAGPLREGRVAIRDADGSSLELRFDHAFAPYAGLWMNWGGWSGCGSAPYFNLGIEPSTAPCDALDVAVSQGQARHLRSGEVLRWTIEVAVLKGGP